MNIKESLALIIIRILLYYIGYLISTRVFKKFSDMKGVVTICTTLPAQAARMESHSTAARTAIALSSTARPVWSLYTRGLPCIGFW